MTASSRAHSFNSAADQYAASRPSYPAALFDLIEQFAGLPLAGARVADVGAGTGIATAVLRQRGANVIGVEPGDAMATQFHTVLPDVPIVRGDGNALPLADASCDLITYAQSWQWTDTTRSVPEALRVLLPGGALGSPGWSARPGRTQPRARAGRAPRAPRCAPSASVPTWSVRGRLAGRPARLRERCPKPDFRA